MKLFSVEGGKGSSCKGTCCEIYVEIKMRGQQENVTEIHLV